MFKVGQLVKIRDVPDNLLWTKNFANKIGLVLERVSDYRYLVLIEAKKWRIHRMDLTVLLESNI